MSDRWTEILPAADALMRQGVAEGVFPGAVLHVSREGHTIFTRAYGVAHRASGRPVTEATVFDLASLTKPLATTLAVMALIHDRRLGLEDRLGGLLPGWEETDKACITIRQLLCHRAGFPAWQPYYETLRTLPPPDRTRALHTLLRDELLHAPPDAQALYSDLDFMVLQAVVERRAGCRLDHWLQQAVYGPLGVRELFFVECGRPRPPKAFAATEDCPWRGYVLEGEVHDDNAFVLGGVAGHAGLFGTAAAVAHLLGLLWAALQGVTVAPPLERELLEVFVTRQAGSDWALGFDTPAAQSSSSGRFFPARSIGHLGFTGTSFWMDLERGLAVVLLTNRVHPQRSNQRIRAFRPALHDAVLEALA
jgi:CubicO group peptidase (beta-lactamase class C family)